MYQQSNNFSASDYFDSSNNFSVSELVLKHNQLKALKSLLALLVQEVNLLEQTQAAAGKQIEREKPICLLTELQRFESHMIRCALIRSMGRQTKAAKLLGLKTFD
jgi:transcriptional regulator with GAF, ATPase, and Fis domain